MGVATYVTFTRLIYGVALFIEPYQRFDSGCLLLLRYALPLRCVLAKCCPGTTWRLIVPHLPPPSFGQADLAPVTVTDPDRRSPRIAVTTLTPTLTLFDSGLPGRYYLETAAPVIP